jgi:hypothetical protein
VPHVPWPYCPRCWSKSSHLYWQPTPRAATAPQPIRQGCRSPGGMLLNQTILSTPLDPEDNTGLPTQRPTSPPDSKSLLVAWDKTMRPWRFEIAKERRSVGVLVASHGIDTCFRHPDKLTLPSPESGPSSASWPGSARERGDAQPCSGPTSLRRHWFWLESSVRPVLVRRICTFIGCGWRAEIMASLPWPHVGNDSRGSDLWRTLIPTVLHSIDTGRCPPLPGVIVYHTTTPASLYSITNWWCSECGGR